MYEQIKMVVCANCRLLFGITADYMQARRNDNQSFYCPSGHQNVYTENVHEKQSKELARQLEQERQWRKTAETEARNATTHARREATRRKNLEASIAAGVCPKCRRSFKNVRRHMEGKHPEFC